MSSWMYPRNKALAGGFMRIFFVSVATIAITMASSALADSPKLKGDYGFTGTAACLVAPGHVGNPNTPPQLNNNPTPFVALPNSGFNAQLRPNDFDEPTLSQSFSRSFSVEGIRTF